MGLSGKTIAWLSKNCGVSLAGKTVVVTGANSGVGFKTAETALYLGANVILACRNPEKAEKAREALLHDYPGASVSVRRLDLSDLDSVDAFADALKNDAVDIHAFVNNAGAFRHPGERTKQGFDLVLGVNYVGVYALSEKLLPYLASLDHEVRYINTISLICRSVRTVDYTDFRFEQPPYRMLAVYGRSKLCLARYTYALAQRYAGTNVSVYMNHPGVAITPLGLDAFGKLARILAVPIRPLLNSPEESALSFAYIMAHDLPAGAIVGPDRCFGALGYPKENRALPHVNEGADALFAFTEQAPADVRTESKDA